MKKIIEHILLTIISGILAILLWLILCTISDTKKEIVEKLEDINQSLNNISHQIEND